MRFLAWSERNGCGEWVLLTKIKIGGGSLADAAGKKRSGRTGVGSSATKTSFVSSGLA